MPRLTPAGRDKVASLSREVPPFSEKWHAGYLEIVAVAAAIDQSPVRSPRQQRQPTKNQVAAETTSSERRSR